MKNLLFTVAVGLGILFSGCNSTSKNTDKAAINESVFNKTEQKADKTKQGAEELNKELDKMIREESNSEK